MVTRGSRAMCLSLPSPAAIPRVNPPSSQMYQMGESMIVPSARTVAEGREVTLVEEPAQLLGG